jgi:glycosyltransferase involved in cell wall biosynthesis
MPLISVIMPTARDEYSVIGQPNTHFLEPTIRSLSNQRFDDFELILVDALKHDRDWDFSKLPYPVKHVPVHRDHRFWLDRKRWSVCGTLNTGLIHAEGELIVRIDDCSEFEGDFLQRFWEAYMSGYWGLAMHIRYLEGKPAKYNEEYREKGYEALYAKKDLEEEERDVVLKRLYGENGLVRDSRYPVVEAHGGSLLAPYNWMYGYSSFTLEAALKVNGFDELFDGDKSLEDVDFGSRLNMAGYKDLMRLDVDHQVIEHEHEPIPLEVLDRDVKPIKCNYAVMEMNRKWGRIKANTGPLTEEQIEYVKKISLQKPCSPQPNFYADDLEGELFEVWKNNSPQFNLREERLNLV